MRLGGLLTVLMDYITLHVPERIITVLSATYGLVAVGVVCAEMIDVECASDCVSDEDSGCDDGHLS